MKKLTRKLSFKAKIGTPFILLWCFCFSGCAYLEYSEFKSVNLPKQQQIFDVNASNSAINKNRNADKLSTNHSQTKARYPKALIWVYRNKESLISTEEKEPPRVFLNKHEVGYLNQGKYLLIEADEGLLNLTVYTGKTNSKLLGNTNIQQLFAKAGRHYFFQLRKKGNQNYYVQEKDIKTAKQKLAKLRPENPKALKAYISRSRQIKSSTNSSDTASTNNKRSQLNTTSSNSVNDKNLIPADSRTRFTQTVETLKKQTKEKQAKEKKPEQPKRQYQENQRVAVSQSATNSTSHNQLDSPKETNLPIKTKNKPRRHTYTEGPKLFIFDD